LIENNALLNALGRLVPALIVVTSVVASSLDQTFPNTLKPMVARLVLSKTISQKRPV
jgi:hypothetical protein